MKAISIKQPWAELIIAGIKNVENRIWKTDYRGRLAIHASKSFDVRWLNRISGGLVGIANEYLKKVGVTNLVYGCILGTVELVDIRIDPVSVWHENGVYGWYLLNPQRFEKPVPAKGQLRLWEVT